MNRETTDDRRDAEPAHARGEAPDADVLRDMVAFAAERLMEIEVDYLTNLVEAASDHLAWATADMWCKNFDSVLSRSSEGLDSDEFRHAWARGAEMTVDLFDPTWNVWDWVEHDLDELRRHWNVTPPGNRR